MSSYYGGRDITPILQLMDENYQLVFEGLKATNQFAHPPTD
jgi:hypothetical protein